MESTEITCNLDVNMEFNNFLFLLYFLLKYEIVLYIVKYNVVHS